MWYLYSLVVCGVGNVCYWSVIMSACRSENLSLSSSMMKFWRVSVNGCHLLCSGCCWELMTSFCTSCQYAYACFMSFIICLISSDSYYAPCRDLSWRTPYTYTTHALIAVAVKSRRTHECVQHTPTHLPSVPWRNAGLYPGYGKKVPIIGLRLQGWKKPWALIWTMDYTHNQTD